MTWTTIATLKIGRDWQLTPEIARDLVWVRLRFSTAGIPLQVVQMDLETGDMTEPQAITATVRRQVMSFPTPPEFIDRAIALRAPGVRTPLSVQIEVSDIMPYVSSGSGAAPDRPATSGSITAINASIQATTLLEANSDRKNAIIINDSTATMFLAFGAAASTSSYSAKVMPGDGWEAEGFTGLISAVWSAANGVARITEFE